MARRDYESVNDYIAAQPKTAQGALARVRDAMRKALPGADELISYKMPTYKLRGSVVIYFACWKQHYSLYPASGHIIAALKGDLAAYEVKKNTIRFPLSEPVPEKLSGRIAKLRAKEVAERAQAKAAKPKRPT